MSVSETEAGEVGGKGLWVVGFHVIVGRTVDRPIIMLGVVEYWGGAGVGGFVGAKVGGYVGAKVGGFVGAKVGGDGGGGVGAAYI